VDGDTSTNDTVLGLASGAAGNAPIVDPRSEEAAQLEAAVTALLQARFSHLNPEPKSTCCPWTPKRVSRRRTHVPRDCGGLLHEPGEPGCKGAQPFHPRNLSRTSRGGRRARQGEHGKGCITG